jgi:hypothetical protein
MVNKIFYEKHAEEIKEREIKAIRSVIAHILLFIEEEDNIQNLSDLFDELVMLKSRLETGHLYMMSRNGYYVEN